MYVMHCTRPDIAFAVCKKSRSDALESDNKGSWLS